MARSEIGGPARQGPQPVKSQFSSFARYTPPSQMAHEEVRQAGSPSRKRQSSTVRSSPVTYRPMCSSATVTPRRVTPSASIFRPDRWCGA